MGKRIISLQEAQSITNDDYLVIDNQSGGTKKVSAGFINDIVSDVEVDGTSVVNNGVAEIDLSGKQDTIVAGSNITIAADGKTISATDTTYTAGTNVQINNGVISATDTTYTAGTNVQIESGVISATDTTYTAGTNVQINNNVISATDTTYTAGTNVQIDNGVISATDTTYTAGTNVDITNGVISATDTTYTAGTGIDITNGVISSNVTPGSTVTITPTLATGTKVADYSINGVSGELYAPSGGSGGSTVTVTQKTSTGTNIADITVDGVTTQLYAPSGGGGASAVADLTDVNLTSLANGQILKYDSTSQKWINSDESGGGNLSYETVFSGSKSTSSWSSPLVFNEFDVTACDIIRITAAHDSYSYTWLIDTSLIPLTGGNTLHIYGEVYCNRNDTELQMYVSTGHALEVSKIESVISGGGGGASAVSDLTDVDLTNLSNGQILKYDATNQKWINADEGGESTEVRRYLGQLCPRVTGTDSHISQSSNGSYGQTVWYSWGAFSDNTITTWGVPDSGAAWVDNHDNSPWISYHFDEPRYFTELTIDCGSNYGGSFTGSIYIEASNDGTAWVDIGSGVKTINAPYQSIGTNTYALDDADTWEYIRIRGVQSFWILDTPSCFMQSINVYGGDIISKSKSDIVVVSRTDNTNGYAWLKPCDANGNTLKPSEVTLLSIFAESDMSGAPPYYNGLNVCVDTDKDRYCCKLYNTQSGDYAPDGTYSVDYTVAYIPNSGGSSGGGSTAAEEITLDEYNELTEQQKNDGTIRFIPNGSTIAETSAIDMSSISSRKEFSMDVSSTSDQVIISWLGGNQIGGTFYYATPIDVTTWDKITFDLTTSSCYGGGSTAQQARWNVQIGLQSEAPSSAQVIDASDSRWIAVKDYANSNTTYDDQEIDVSELIGSYYLVINAHGWNAIIDDFTLEKIGAIYPSQIKYMSKTYALEGDMHTYSTTEHQVGTWIDGSDLYEKTISISNVSLSSGSYETVDTITGLDTIISCNGYVVEGNLKYTLNDIMLRVIQDGTFVKMYSPSGTTWTISSGAIIIRYTKVAAS